MFSENTAHLPSYNIRTCNKSHSEQLNNDKIFLGLCLGNKELWLRLEKDHGLSRNSTVTWSSY